MLKNFKLYNSKENKLYNNILLLSRNRIFYTKFNLSDTFKNRIYLIFIHISFLFIKIKQNKDNDVYKTFYQKIFDLLFYKIELNIREIGYGDVEVNKKMKILVNSFYSILLNCETYREKSISFKSNFFLKYLELNHNQKKPYNMGLIKYFDEFEAFCFDLSSDGVLKGDLNFIYK